MNSRAETVGVGVDAATQIEQVCARLSDTLDVLGGGCCTADFDRAKATRDTNPGLAIEQLIGVRGAADGSVK